MQGHYIQTMGPGQASVTKPDASGRRRKVGYMYRRDKQTTARHHPGKPWFAVLWGPVSENDAFGFGATRDEALADAIRARDGAAEGRES